MNHLSRRSLLQFATAASALAATGTIPALVQSAFANDAPTAQPKTLPWRNWSGGQTCTPAMRAAPADEAELADLIAKAATPIRAVGAGHSFSPLVPTNGTLLTLDRIAGVTAIEAKTHQADILAGTRLARMSDDLAKAGLALDNMPDINKQSLAGAISTATHGTGSEIGSLSTFLQGLRLVTASGKAIDCDAKRQPEIFQAARVSLGALGIITKARIQARPLYKLKRRTWVAPVEEMLEQVSALEAKNRNFEFYYIPYSGMALGISNNETDEAETPAPVNEDDDGLRQLKMLDDWLGWSPGLRRWTIQKILGGMEPEERVDFSHKTLSTERGVRFNEMEYHLPREAAPAALREIIETIEKNNIKVFFPIEFRTVAADDIWLSPFYGRKSASIAVHQFYEWDYKPYFTAIEPIFRKHDGRPHWGKLNTLEAADFAAIYPKWKDFLKVRAELDPKGKFLNPYLRKVFGVA
ncbi:MAG: D-arabinono-1,4-lactone oxidase [Parvibaculum sp.]|uniref:D-arabinono-1,4-lactone oxidase n=1 Tax=Parvibaculum sp. TaxID=2024848 RepID=UPI003C73CDEF